MTDKLSYINFNGNLKKTELPVLKSSNRAFLYGDGLFETMHANGSEIQFLPKHFNRLNKSAEKIHFIVPTSFTPQLIQKETKRLFQRCKYYKGARVRLSVFRNEGGAFLPTDNNLSWLIEIWKLKTDNYTINTKGLTIDIFEEIKKPANYFSDMKTANSLLFVMAGLHSQQVKADDSLIVNDAGNIIEASSSNIFIVKNNKLITPDCSEGCLPGIMRQHIINLARNKGIELSFESINKASLLAADEVFLTNAIKGISWVAAYRGKRYYNKIGKLLSKGLNDDTAV